MRKNQRERAKHLRDKTEWSETDVRELASLSRMKEWIFRPGSRFERGSLKHLATLPHMHFLSFEGSELASEDVTALANVAKLKRLKLEKCSISKASITTLAERLAAGAAPQLIDLWLEGTPIGDDVLAVIGKIERLEWLTIGCNPITDEGLAHLRGVSMLRTLWANETEITDAGLLQLAGLPRLSGVVTRGTSATPAGLQALSVAQVAAQKKSNRPIDPDDKAAGLALLKEFRKARSEWNVVAARRTKEIEQRHRASRPKPNVFAPSEGESMRQLWTQIRDEARAIYARYCTPLKSGSKQYLWRNEGSSYGIPAKGKRIPVRILDVEQPSKNRMLIITGLEGLRKHRYLLLRQNGRWLLDSCQQWDGGWKRTIL